MRDNAQRSDVPRPNSMPVRAKHRTRTCSHEYAAATNGLLYLQLVHDLPALDPGELALLPLFCEYLTELGAGAESYLETQTRRARMGNIGAYASARQSLTDTEALNGRFVVTAKGLQRHRDGLAENLFEVLRHVRFDEFARLKDLIAQSRVDADASITDRGHVLAMQGAARGLSRGAWLDDVWEGPGSIVTVQGADRDVQADDAALARLAQAFELLREKILAGPSRIVVVAEAQNIADTSSVLARFADPVAIGNAFHAFELPPPAVQAGQGWLTNTQVNFCARVYRAVPEAHEDAPALAVLARYLSDGYLHPAIRERGGAYGGGAQYDTDSMTFRFFSYRDPRLTETLADFDRALPWLHENRDSQRLEESILGVIRSLDNPRSPAGTALRAFYDALDHRTPAFRKAFREGVLGTTFEQVCGAAARYLDPQGAATGVVTDAGHRAEVEALQLEAVKL
jgi:Zn-dependent M16 (insulinase) family peptidase